MIDLMRHVDKNRKSVKVSTLLQQKFIVVSFHIFVDASHPTDRSYYHAGASNDGDYF